MTRRLRPFVLALALGFLVSSTATAQVAIGIFGGVNSTSPSGGGTDSLDLGSKTGGQGGGYVNIYLGHRFSVEGQVLFSGQGLESDTSSVSEGYFEIPALLKVYFGKLNVFAGPSLSWQVSCTVDAEAATGDCESSSTSVLGGVFGAGLQFGRLGAEVHYQTGYGDTLDDVDYSYGLWALNFRFAILGSR